MKVNPTVKNLRAFEDIIQQYEQSIADLEAGVAVKAALTPFSSTTVCKLCDAAPNCATCILGGSCIEKTYDDMIYIKIYDGSLSSELCINIIKARLNFLISRARKNGYVLEEV